MAYEQILYDVSDWIATITLNRPEKLNAWTIQMEEEYRHAMADAELREDVRVIIVTGAGRAFCAGADISLLSSVQEGKHDFAAQKDRKSNPGQGADVREDFQKPYSFPPAVRKPIVAALPGHTIGLGLVHAVYCDVRFASDRAKFGTAFVQRGLIAEHGIGWLLPRLIGPAAAMDLLFSGRMIDAAEALQVGLVNRVVPHDELLPTVREYASQIATQSSPRAVSIMKRQVWDSLMMDLGPAIDVAIEEMFACFPSDDFREGVQSFVEKRPPQFTGK